MRIILSFLLIVFIQSSLLAQTVPNRGLWIGLNAMPGYSSERRFSVAPRVGYWVNQRVLTGLEGRFSIGSASASVRSWGIGAFGRYYLGNGSILFFPHVGLGYEQFNAQSLASASAVVARPAVGIRFGNLSRPFGVELLVDKPFSFSKQAAEIGNLRSQFGISLGVQFSF